MIFYRTDNSISMGVSRAFEKGGVQVKHVDWFDHNEPSPIFYGILRGTGSAIRTLQHLEKGFTYLDNGYFNAVYVDKNRLKDMGGMYRVVKNDLIEPYTEGPDKVYTSAPMKVLILPPTPYMAFMYDTTPEDWNCEWINKVQSAGHTPIIRSKETQFDKPIAQEIAAADAVLAFNSMSVMQAAKMGKAIYTTNGIVRNADKVGSEIQYFDYGNLEEFYETKQFTLEEIGEGLWI